MPRVESGLLFAWGDFILLLYRKVLLILLALSVGVYFLFQAGSVYAAQQPGFDIRISQVETIQQSDGMLVRIYFEFYNGQTSQVISNVQASSARLTLLSNGYKSDAVVQVPIQPIYLLLLLDSSGSMTSAAENLRAAAKQLLASPPDKAYFGVVQFDEGALLLQDFSQNMSTVANAINRYAVRQSGTCLYDQAYSAIETVLGKLPEGRRALILFTDGKDEKQDGSVCSRHTLLEVTELAQKKHIPIHAIGLSESGKVNALELKNLSDETGGISGMASSKNNLGETFRQMLEALKSQWMVETTIYPNQGDNQAELVVGLKDGSSLSKSLIISSGEAYVGPPSPVQARVDGFNYDKSSKAYTLQLSLTSPQLVDYLHLSVWDKKTNTKILDEIHPKPIDHNVFQIPAADFISGHSYELHISAISKENGTAFEIQPKGNNYSSNFSATELIHEFLYETGATSPEISLKSVEPNENNFILWLETKNANEIASYEGWLIKEDTGTKAPNSDFSVSNLEPGGRLTLYLEDKGIQAGKYKIVVRALGAKKELLAQLTSDGVVYTPKTVSPVDEVFTAILKNPVILGAIALVLVFMVAFVVFYTRNERKRATALPILSTQIEDTQGGQTQRRAVPVNRVEVQDPKRERTVDITNAGGKVNPITSNRPRSSLKCLKNKSIPNQVGTIYPISTVPFVIGREEGQLIVPVKSMSRRHVVINYDDQRRCYTISDEGSRNGTRITDNDKPELLSPHSSIVLTPGASIELGPEVMFIFEMG
jgi:VWFA-related protein